MVNAGLRRGISIAVVGGLLAVGCSSSGDDQVATDTDPGETTIPTADTERPDPNGPIDTPPASGDGLVSTASLASPTVEEIDRVRITGIDTTADLGELELFLHASGVEPIPMELYLDEEGLYTVVGLHPVAPVEGGPVELQLVDGSDRSAPLPLTITALPPAPGAWDRTIDDLLAELTTRAEEGGSTLAELADTDPSALDPELTIVKMVAGLVDDGTDNDLQSLPDREGLTDDERSLLDAMIAKLDPLIMTPDTGPIAPVGFRNPTSRPTAAPTARPLPAQAGSCIQYPLQINTVQQMADAVKTGVGAKRVEGGAVEKLTQDVAALAGNTGTANDAAGAAGGIGGVAVVNNLVGMVDTMYATMNLWFDADAGRYPTVLSSITANIDTDEFNEDFEDPGTVTDVQLTAESTGFDAAEALSKIASAAVNAIAGTVTGKVKEGMALDRVDEAVVFGGEKLRDTITGKLIRELGDEYANFCPQSWTVPATDPDYVKVEGVIGRIEADESAMTYQPKMLGDDFVRVSARRGAFSGLYAYEDHPVSTKQLQVVATPEKILVKSPGDPAEITAEVRHAEHPSLSWEPEAGTWADGNGAETEEGGTRVLNTPEAEGAYPFLVTIESTSKTGLRKDATDVRNDVVEIQLQGLFIDPDPGRVLTERSLQFTATDREGKPREVTWQATGGSIDENGMYTAGKRPGTYTVTATAKDDPKVTATATVIVSEADCLIGTWRLRSQEFLDQIAALTAMPGGGTIEYRSGEYRVELRDDGSMVGNRDAWSFAVDSPQGTLIATITSTETGTWAVDDDTISLLEGSSDATVDLAIEIGGQLMPVPGGSQQVSGETISGSGTYECTGDVLTTALTDITATFDRIG